MPPVVVSAPMLGLFCYECCQQVFDIKVVMWNMSTVYNIY